MNTSDKKSRVVLHNLYKQDQKKADLNTAKNWFPKNSLTISTMIFEELQHILIQCSSPLSVTFVCSNTIKTLKHVYMHKYVWTYKFRLYLWNIYISSGFLSYFNFIYHFSFCLLTSSGNFYLRTYRSLLTTYCSWRTPTINFLNLWERIFAPLYYRQCESAVRAARMP